MSKDTEQELPQADGPLVKVRLPDNQTIYTALKSRCRETDGRWMDLQIHLPSMGSERGRLLAVPAAVDFWAPAGVREPVEGQSHDAVPTVRVGVTPDWKVEEPVYFGTTMDPARIDHRGDCGAVRDVSRPVSTRPGPRRP